MQLLYLSFCSHITGMIFFKLIIQNKLFLIHLLAHVPLVLVILFHVEVDF